MSWRARALLLASLVWVGRGVAADPPDLADRYRATADKLIDAAMADNEGYNRLAYLCYRIGNRLSGSAALERAIAWSVEQMKAAGLSNVRVIPTKVPHWVRNSESARMLAPLDRPLHMLGLGMSVGTPAGRHHRGRGSGVELRGTGQAGPREGGGQDRGLQLRLHGYGSGRNYRADRRLRGPRRWAR